MTAGRSPPRTLRPATGGSDHQKPLALQGLANTANTDTQPRVRERDGGLEADRLRDGWRDRPQPAASGVEGLTAQAYEATRQANITALGARLKPPRYRAQRVRRWDRPQANGTARP
jgi:hypothetical protein